MDTYLGSFLTSWGLLEVFLGAPGGSEGLSWELVGALWASLVGLADVFRSILTSLRSLWCLRALSWDLGSLWVLFSCLGIVSLSLSLSLSPSPSPSLSLSLARASAPAVRKHNKGYASTR